MSSKPIVPVFNLDFTSISELNSENQKRVNKRDFLISAFDFKPWLYRGSISECSIIKTSELKSIKDTTITMSIDGEKFYTMEEVKEALEFKEKYDEKCIINPSTWHQGFNVSYECPHCGNLVYDKKRLVECDMCHKKLDWRKVDEQ